jgi:hypothetical protein
MDASRAGGGGGGTLDSGACGSHPSCFTLVVFNTRQHPPLLPAAKRPKTRPLVAPRAGDGKSAAAVGGDTRSLLSMKEREVSAMRERRMSELEARGEAKETGMVHCSHPRCSPSKHATQAAAQQQSVRPPRTCISLPTMRRRLQVLDAVDKTGDTDGDTADDDEGKNKKCPCNQHVTRE